MICLPVILEMWKRRSDWIIGRISTAALQFLMFFALYLACRQIRAKEKVVTCTLLLFFLASFSINVLNFIWHGFHYPNSLPCRQSYIYIFLVLSACYRAYTHLEQIPWKQITGAFAGAVVFVLLAQKLTTESHFHFIVFYVAILFLALYLGVIYLYKKGIKYQNLELSGADGGFD